MVFEYFGIKLASILSPNFKKSKTSPTILPLPYAFFTRLPLF